MKNSKIFIVLFFVLSLGFPACSGGGGGTSNSPSKTVEKAYEYYMSKKYDKMAAMYISGDNKKLTEEEIDKIKAMMPFATKQDEEKGGLKSFEVIEETIAEDGNTAKVKIKKVYGNGEEDTEKISMIKIDGDWFMELMSY